MNIKRLIDDLNQIHEEHGDIEVMTDDYAGAEYELREPRMVVKTNDSRAVGMVVILNG
jgi:hypothetical protein